MSQYPPPNSPLPMAPPQPSYTGPVLLAAMGAAIMFTMPALMSRITGEGESICCMNCCATFGAASLGVLPIMLIRRIGGYPTAGTGCVIGFFGVGIGGLVGAILQAAFPSLDTESLRAAFAEMYEQLQRSFAEQGQNLEVTEEEFIGSAMTLSPYAPVMFVAISAFLGGAIGMIFAMTGRRPPPQPPWQHPPQYPPQQPPPPPQV